MRVGGCGRDGGCGAVGLRVREDLLWRRRAAVRWVVGVHGGHGAPLLVLVLVLMGLVGVRDAGL